MRKKNITGNPTKSGKSDTLSLKDYPAYRRIYGQGILPYTHIRISNGMLVSFKNDNVIEYYLVNEANDELTKLLDPFVGTPYTPIDDKE